MGQHSKDNTKYTVITVCGQWLGTWSRTWTLDRFADLQIYYMYQHNYLTVFLYADTSANASTFSSLASLTALTYDDA